MSSVDDAIAGRWSAWEGLDAGTTERDVERALQAGGAGARSAGREWGRLAGQQVHTRTWHRDEPPDAVRVWFDGIGEAVLLAEFRGPRADVDVDGLDAVLGAPDRVGLPRRLVPGRVEERVWWRRGIAVTVTGAPARSHEGAGRGIGLVQVFVPTDLQGWVTRLGGEESEGPSPSPGPRP